MLHNLRYLEFGQPPLDEDDQFTDPDEEFTADQAATDIPPLRASAVPQGYYSPDDNIPVAGLDRTLQATPPRNVVNYPMFRETLAAEQPVTVPVPSDSPLAPVTPISDGPGWVSGTDQPDNPLPFRNDSLPAPAARVIGKDRNLQGALETARQIDAQMPIRPKPKLLNSIAAGALGAAAGYSNAARRAAPIDVKTATDPILYPGYDQKLASWQSRQAAAKQQVENFGQQVGAEMASQKAQSEAQLKYAQAEAAIKHGDYWERRSEQERNQWKIAPDGSLYNTIDGQRVVAPPSAGAKYKAAMAITGGDKEKSAYYALNGKLPAPTQHNVSEWQSYLDANGGDSTKALAAKNRDDIHKAIASRDPSVAGYRNFEEQTARDAMANKVNKERVDEEQRIHSDMQAKLTQLTTAGQNADRPRREAQIKAAAAAALTAMQQKYADAIRRGGGTAEDMDVDPVTLQWKPRVAAANPYAPSAGNPYRRAGQ